MRSDRRHKLVGDETIVQEMFDEMEYQSIELLPGDIADGEVGSQDNSLSLTLSADK